MKLPVKAGFFIISELKISTDYLMHSETFNFQKNSKLTTFSFENSDLTDHIQTFFIDSLALNN